MTETFLNHVVLFNVIQITCTQIGRACFFRRFTSWDSDKQPDLTGSDRQTNIKSITQLLKRAHKLETEHNL